MNEQFLFWFFVVSELIGLYTYFLQINNQYAKYVGFMAEAKETGFDFRFSVMTHYHLLLLEIGQLVFSLLTGFVGILILYDEGISLWSRPMVPVLSRRWRSCWRWSSQKNEEQSHA